MSNRLLQVGRIPLIPDPHVALKASQALSGNQAQTERAVTVGRAFFEPLKLVGAVLHRFGNGLERALRIRNMATMNDAALADIGVRRDQLPQIFYGPAVDAKPGPNHAIRLSDVER